MAGTSAGRRAGKAVAGALAALLWAGAAGAQVEASRYPETDPYGWHLWDEFCADPERQRHASRDQRAFCTKVAQRIQVRVLAPLPALAEEPDAGGGGRTPGGHGRAP